MSLETVEAVIVELKELVRLNKPDESLVQMYRRNIAEYSAIRAAMLFKEIGNG